MVRLTMVGKSTESSRSYNGTTSNELLSGLSEANICFLLMLPFGKTNRYCRSSDITNTAQLNTDQSSSTMSSYGSSEFTICSNSSDDTEWYAILRCVLQYDLPSTSGPPHHVLPGNAHSHEVALYGAQFNS